MGDELPWNEIERYYNSRLNNRYMGTGNKTARMVADALIVKHKMNLSDEETILAIQENPYMQYMLGLSEYTEAPVFDPSLFVTIRKRLQISDLNSFTDALLKLSIRKEDSVRNDKEDSEDNQKDSGDSDTFIDSSLRSTLWGNLWGDRPKKGFPRPNSRRLWAKGMRNPVRSLQENRTGIPNYRSAGTYLFSSPQLIFYCQHL